MALRWGKKAAYPQVKAHSVVSSFLLQIAQVLRQEHLKIAQSKAVNQNLQCRDLNQGNLPKLKPISFKRNATFGLRIKVKLIGHSSLNM